DFAVLGSEGLPADPTSGFPADDTAASAHAVTFSTAGTAQAAGAIGDDPFYNPSSTDPFPGDDIDVYHFTVSGPGDYAFVADLRAGRVGSPLFAEATLFRAVTDPITGLTTSVQAASNAGSGNGTTATGGPIGNPLASDPVLFAGLTAGDYFLVVSNSGG